VDRTINENEKAMKLLQKHFDIALETPDGIKKLRELILTLAMQGKLVSQDPKDQPASELLKEIDENIFQKNVNWKHLKLKKIFELNYGKGVPKEKISDKGFPVYGANGILKYSTNYLIENKCLIVGRKGSAGAINISEGPSWPSDVTYYIIPPDYIDFTFTYYLLINLNLPSLAKGIKPGLNRNEAYEITIGIPPLSEQKRIVAKIDQLMVHCDKLEVQRNERNQKRLTIHTAAMNRFLSSQDKESFSDSWDFITDHFGELYSVKENVAELKKAILQLAVMGKLVPQDPKDQPASELLKEIEAAKKRLVKEGKIRKQEPLAPIKPEEIPYEVPKGWKWVKLDDISEYIQRGKSPKYSDEIMIPIISQKCVQWSGFNKDVVKFIEPQSINQYQEERFIKPGDLLWNSTGTGTLGRVNIYQNELSTFSKVVTDSHVTIVRPFMVNNYFVLKYLIAPVVQKDIEKNASGTTNQIELNTTTIKNQIIPLPPLAEQKRIVAKIDQLMALCDELEKRIACASDKQAAILNAVLAQI